MADARQRPRRRAHLLPIPPSASNAVIRFRYYGSIWMFDAVVVSCSAWAVLAVGSYPRRSCQRSSGAWRPCRCRLRAARATSRNGMARRGVKWRSQPPAVFSGDLNGMPAVQPRVIWLGNLVACGRSARWAARSYFHAAFLTTLTVTACCAVDDLILRALPASVCSRNTVSRRPGCLLPALDRRAGRILFDRRGGVNSVKRHAGR